MADYITTPLENQFETQIVGEISSGLTAPFDITVKKAVSFTPESGGFYAVLEPGTSKEETLKISAVSGTTWTVSQRGIPTAKGGTSTATTHGGGAKIIITDNWSNWDDIATAINSKAGLSENETISGDWTFTGDNVFGGSIKEPVYADSTARDTGIPSPVNGMVIYNTADGKFQDYTAGSWVDRESGGTFANASETVAGKVEIATTSEATAGTDTGGTGATLVVKPSDILTLLVTYSSPTGLISPFAGSSAPTGWLICDGSAVSRATYSSLFSVIADSYGVGDGSTTFNLPNLKNRIPIGLDTSVKVVIDNCDAAWTAGANVVASNDTGDKKEGTGSVKLAVGAAAGAGQILGYKVISVADLYGKTKVGFWIKSSIALNAGDLQYKLDDTAAIASALETINIPALQAGVWTKVYLTLANPSLDLNIISHGIYQVNDKGAFDLWIDDINYGENYELGADGGEKTHLLTANESGLVAHSHSQQKYSGSGSSLSDTFTGATYSAAGGVTSTVASASAVASHNNLQPYQVVNYIIKT